MKTSRTYLIPLEGGGGGVGGYRLIGRVISRTVNIVELGQNVVKRTEYFEVL
jgi:hypothetical protein